jgi:hypothetical protein
MSSKSINEKLLELNAQMTAAAEALDFEKASELRNEIARLKGELPPSSGEEETVTVGQPPPGAMGLGTQVPVRQPPKGWVKPKKPDFMTKNVKGR